MGDWRGDKSSLNKVEKVNIVLFGVQFVDVYILILFLGGFDEFSKAYERL